jgi:hypothetical protein
MEWSASKGQAGANIFLGEIGKSGVAHTRNQILHNIGAGHADAAETGFAAALAGFKGDEFLVVHCSEIIGNPARVKAEGDLCKDNKHIEPSTFDIQPRTSHKAAISFCFPRGPRATQAGFRAKAKGMFNT